MATVERTAYPRFAKVFSIKELRSCYSPRAEGLDCALVARKTGRGDTVGVSWGRSVGATPWHR